LSSVDERVAERALVVGLAVTGEAVARQLLRRGTDVIAVDDAPADAARERSRQLGIDLVEAPDVAELDRILGHVDLVLPSPGVPAHHPVFAAAAARGLRVWSEFELASRWSSTPLVAITGTNGKTTVTTLVADMLRRAGLRTVAAGNTDVPLVDVLDDGLDVIVVEASSFRLQFTETFRPAVAVWLNMAEDHLDWHPSIDDYAAAKARIWANQSGGDVAIVNADDAVVMAAARSAPARVESFSIVSGRHADWYWDHERDVLVGPDVEVASVRELPRALPHDVANDLAASAAAMAAGATAASCRAVVTSFTGLPHRVALVRDAGGVRYYDDSKSTTPASVLAAVRGFDSVVLIAGGRNKGLDLSVLGMAAPPVRTVVAIGEAADDILTAFTGRVPASTAHSMDEAVQLAAGLAAPGDVVLLSPGCASFDWYHSYAERGDDFARAVRQLAVGATG
jgi:UDP-N-acetylmuramoylalanine--D-glutamate ligase